MSLELSTAGITLQYAVGADEGATIPTTGFVKIPGIKAIPDFNPEPTSLDVTDLSETEYKRYIPGLKDVGSSMAFTANYTQPFQDLWRDVVDEFDTAKAANKALWFVIVVPGLTDAFYFIGEPSPLGLPSASVDVVLEVDAYIAPVKIEGWKPKPA